MSSATSRRSFLLASLCVLCSATPLRAQCPDWTPGFNLAGIQGGHNSLVSDFAIFDDGSRPALFVGGRFQFAGEVRANCVAKWDGTSWSALGTGMSGYVGIHSPEVRALAVYDDGSGPALYAGGIFQNAGGVAAEGLAKWNGSTWSSVNGWHLLGFDPFVGELAALDTGSGPALVVGGRFAVPGHPGSNGIARWNGSSWSGFGSGISPSGDFVNALVVFDDGSGPGLYAGGRFTSIGNTSASRIARWDGTGWSALGSGMSGGSFPDVYTMTVFDDGSGPALIAGGNFSDAGGVSVNGIARWEGSSWSALGLGLGTVVASTVFDDGSGPALYAGGYRWDGTAWASLGEGVGDVMALEGWDDGSGPSLYAGGMFQTAGGVDALHVARWRNSTWSTLGNGNGVTGQYPGISGQVTSLGLYDDGRGTALYAAGYLEKAGDVPVHNMARWDGSSWSSVASGVDGTVDAMKAFDDGSGPALYVGGAFTTVGGVGANAIAKWNGSSWSSVGTGVAGSVHAISVFDDGSGAALYVGGSFFSTAGGVGAGNIAKWDGSKWTPLGTGVEGSILAMAVFDDGSGPALYVGGSFSTAGGVGANNIAKWDGSKWTPLGTGLPGPVWALQDFDDRSGPGLCAGGGFIAPGDGSHRAYRVARWDGSSWSPLGAGMTTPGGTQCVVLALARLDEDGFGEALFAAGTFTSADGEVVNHVARWDGTRWSPLGSGITLPNWTGKVNALAVGDVDADGAFDLYLGGYFIGAGDVAAENIAEWRGCVHAGIRLCFGDGSSGPCPCGNDGLRGRGCNNSIDTGGARLAEDGLPSLALDSLVLTSSGERTGVLSVFFQGQQTIPAVFSGDGLRCAGGSLRRLYSKSAIGGVVTAPQTGDLSISARSAALGDPLSVGSTRTYQVYYRDNSATFCPYPAGNTWNVSSAVQIDWRP